MQTLKDLITKGRSKQSLGDNDLRNLTREYLQVQILKAIYASKYGKGMTFVGGTCLRICHGLKRFSEDLDFCLDRNIPAYSFNELHEKILFELEKRGFKADYKLNETKIVQKSFIRFPEILNFFDLSPLRSQKLHVKLEIDTNPIKIPDQALESFFVAKFNENFPVLKHSDPTLFAGKIAAVLQREYAKGRDFYDLIWYLNNKTEIDFNYLKKALDKKNLSKDKVFKLLDKRVSQVKPKEILGDVEQFLENREDTGIIMDYPRAYRQAAERYLKT